MFNKDYVLESVGCQLDIEETIVAGTGRVMFNTNDNLVFTTEGKRYSFQILDKSIYQQVVSYLKRGLYCVAEKTDNEHGLHFHLRLVFFAGIERWGAVPLVVSGDILAKVETKLKKKLDNLDSLFSLTIGSTKHFVYSMKTSFQDTSYSSEADNDIEIESENIDKSLEDSETDDNQLQNDNVERHIIRIYGENCMIQACLIGEDMDAYLAVEKIQFRVNNVPCLRLGIGSLSFTSQREFASKKVRDTLATTPGYISLWDQYSDKEGEFLLRKAREVGMLSWISEGITAEQNGILIPVKQECLDALRIIQAGDYISFDEEAPSYLIDPDLTWKEWKASSRSPRSDNHSEDSQQLKQSHSAKLVSKQVKVIKNTGRALLLEIQSLPKGFASLSIVGDEKQIERRKKSRDRIRQGLAANPNLGYIIEGIPYMDSSSVPSRKHYDPLSPLVLDKIFSHPPTPTQRRAIEIALNTPDIAIIQGPPGTGKTTVITAIIERLNELADKNSTLRGEVLVTSLQHDAVKNIQERLSINSLPTIKFGTSRKQGQDVEFDIATETWCETCAKKLRERHTGLRKTEAEIELSRLIDRYIRTPNESNALLVLKYSSELTTDKSLSDDIRSLIQELEIHSRDEYNDIINIVRRLRTNRTAFGDDGPERAMDAYISLEGMLIQSESSNRILSVLQRAAMMKQESITDELLIELETVQEELLDRCFPPPYYRQPTVRKDILSVCERVQQEVRNAGNEEERILSEFLDELEHNTMAVRESLKNYCFVFTATLQQSEGRDIHRAKGLSMGKEMEYDTVIVDEAARANPGDLMIPLARVRSKIILVGDHRQLPHMYDEEIFDELKSTGSTVDESDIKISLFQHLFENAKKLEEADNIQRTVTLDAQYRMHPTLGHFVSEMFYENYDEQFDSPLPETLFEQPLVPAPLEWINVRPDCGKEERDLHKSRFRIAEARIIVDRICEYLANPQTEKMSFGIISFYSAQVNKIRKMLEDSGDYVTEAMRTGRLRVGSVDSFQGMEFDVIFLSVVRSGARFEKIDMRKLSYDKEYLNTVGMSTYGFLTSENRLCVALSRQKKLLVVVGDASMFSGGNAESVADLCVPAMPALFKLCKEKGVVEEC